MEALVPSVPAPTGERRRRAAGLLLGLITAAIVAVGGWGVISSLNTEAPPARVGDPVRVPGGLLLVENVTPEHMASMQTGKFAQAGMSGMDSMGMDMAPEGQRRLVVDATLAAERGDLSYSPEEFRISGKGMNKDASPIRHQFDAGTIPAGGTISGSLVFQVPEEASALMLNFGEGGQKVALDLKPTTESEGHSHGAAQSEGAQSEGDGHSDHHHD